MYPVTLNVYDLSRGLARVYLPMVGVQIDAVYHTSLTVYGKEFYIDQGIKKQSNAAKYGPPIESRELGETEVDEETFTFFLEEMKDYHLPEKYDLFFNNCNHFTNACIQLLLDQELDKHILELPEKVLNSPNGMMFRNMLGIQ